MTGYHYSEAEWRALLPWVSRAIPVPPVLIPPVLIPPAPARPGAGTAALQDRVRGMLLGLAIGDSLGNTSEGMKPAERHRVYGTIRDYLPNRREDMLPVGLPSDDTQLTFWTVESLLRRGYLDPVDLAEAFTRQHRIFGIGRTMTAFLFASRFGGKAWFEAGQPSAGNGALMRIAPVLLPHLRRMSEDLWVDVVATTVLTHRDEAAVAASVGFAGLLAECLALPESGAPPASWWPETFLRYGRPVENAAAADIGATRGAYRRVSYRSRVPGDPFRGSLCERVEQEVFRALKKGESVLSAAKRWYSGAYLLETVPCVLHILACHGGDPEEAIVRAVNDTKDNDTVAAIVGAAVGALHGVSSLPARWREGLLGRTREADDHDAQRLIEQALEAFVD
jgi:ADP-ribosyl-[dinitrogen reductase] hydrolase